MHVSCLMITEGRPEFAEWALWNYIKQTYISKDLVIVHGPNDHELLTLVKRKIPKQQVTLYEAPAGARVPVKRNIALRLAKGEILTWFDDDDWSSHERLDLTVRAYRDAQTSRPDIRLMEVMDKISYYHLPSRVAYKRLFGSWQYAIYDTATAKTVEFEEWRKRGSDSHWYAALATKIAGEEAGRRASVRNPNIHGITHVGLQGLGFAVSHGKNVCNQLDRIRRMRHVKGGLEQQEFITNDAEWETTLAYLKELEGRLKA